MIVAADADLDRAATALTKGGFYHAGQVCVSVQRIFAHGSIVDELGRQLATRAAALKVGDPDLGEAEVGPLIRPAEVDRVHAWVEEAVAGGGTLLCGGEAISESCYQPTVVLDPPADCRLSREEVFGPVVAVYRFEDFYDACARANDLPVLPGGGFHPRLRDRDAGLSADLMLQRSCSIGLPPFGGPGRI